MYTYTLATMTFALSQRRKQHNEAATSPRIDVVKKDVSDDDCAEHTVRSKYIPLQYDVNYEDVPEYTRTKNIIRGYRVGGNYTECLFSLFKWHNDCLNAWTMIVAYSISTCYVAYLLASCNIPTLDSILLLLYACGHLFHLPFTVGYHLFVSISETVAGQWLRYDVCAVYFSKFFTVISMSYFAYDDNILLLLNIIIGLIVAIWGIIKFWNTNHDSVPNKLQQALYVGAMVLCFVTPMVYVAVLNQGTTAAIATIILLVSTFIGASCYAFGIPERLCPGVFDILLNSHVVMHIAIICNVTMECLFMHERLVTKNNINDH